MTLVVTKFSNSGACDKQKHEQNLHYDEDKLRAHSNWSCWDDFALYNRQQKDVMWPVNCSSGTPAQHPEQHSYSSQQNPAKQYIHHPLSNL